MLPDTIKAIKKLYEDAGYQQVLVWYDGFSGFCYIHWTEPGGIAHGSNSFSPPSMYLSNAHVGPLTANVMDMAVCPKPPPLPVTPGKHSYSVTASSTFLCHKCNAPFAQCTCASHGDESTPVLSNDERWQPMKPLDLEIDPDPEPNYSLFGSGSIERGISTAFECYFCGTRHLTIVALKKHGASICGPCARIHLGQEVI